MKQAQEQLKGRFADGKAIVGAPPNGQERDPAKTLERRSHEDLQARLNQAETKLDNLEKRWPGVIFSQNADLSFSYVSPRIEELTGIAPENWLAGRESFLRVVHEADVEGVTRHLQQGQTAAEAAPFAFRIRHRSTGRIAHIWENRQGLHDAQGRLLGYEGIWMDVTREAMAEKRLSTLAWMETLSLLTTGLVHDFNNVLSGILSLSENFEAQIGPDHPFFEGISLIRQNTSVGIQLMRRLRCLYHWKVGERNYHDLNEAVAEVAELIKKVALKSIIIETDLAPGQLPVYMDAVEFRQVVINLALNACQAMLRGGRLRLVTSRHDEYPSLAHVTGPLPRLPALCLAVQDEGCGIPQSNFDVLFDPFFTTKAMNHGSGLGLYNARLFAEKHHGAISVVSAERVGSTFHVWLPGGSVADADEAESSHPKRHTLLLAGEAGLPLDSTAELLRQSGYYVVVPRPGESASDLLNSPDFEFSAVMVLIRRRTPDTIEILNAVREQRLPFKTIVQVIGCDQDELESRFLSQVDLVIPPGLPEQKILRKIGALLDETVLQP